VPASTALVLLLSGCGLINPPGSAGPGGVQDAGGGGGGGGSFGQPTLEVTIGGMHFGPSAPDTGSGVDLTTQRDATSQIVSQSLSISASSAASGASCALGFQRYGTSLSPLRGGNQLYMVSSQSISATPDGVVAPAASESVSAQGVVLSCSGSACDGTGLLLVTLAADHVEGTYTGTLSDPGGQGAAEAVCSFWLPTRTWQP
jgi:hypothetical protein